MDQWGQGPWFEPEEPADTPASERSPASEDEAGAGTLGTSDPPRRRITSRPYLPPRGVGGQPSRPLDRQGEAPDGWTSWGTIGGFADGFASAGLGADEGEPRANSVSRPLGASPFVSSGARTFPPVSATYSRPLTPPLPESPASSAPRHPGPPLGAAGSAWGGTGGPGGPGGPGQKGQPRRKRRALVLVTVLLLALAVSSLLVLAPGHSKKAANSQNTGQIAATNTVGAPATQTPIPPPTAASLSFTAASQQLSLPGKMTACPSGCDLTGKGYTNSKTFSESNSASQVPQSALIGTIHAVNSSTTQDWSVSQFAFSGGGYACDKQDILLPAGSSNDYPCFIPVPTPSIIPKGTISGTASANPKVVYTQAADIVGNGHYEVLAANCQNALSDLKNNQGTPWATNWMSSQTVPPGWTLAQSAPTISFANDTCPVGTQQSTAFNFTASTTAQVSDAAYNPSDATNLAASRLNGALPGGYAWRNGSKTSCVPSVTSVSGTTITLNCSDSGFAVYSWTSDLKSQLAGKVAGQSKQQALSICNGAVGVKPNSCSITIQGGDGTLLPASASVVTIQANGP